MKYQIKAGMAGLCLAWLMATTTMGEEIAATPAIIPQPQAMEIDSGTFHLRPDIRIFTDRASRRTARQLVDALHPVTGYALDIQLVSPADESVTNGILLTTHDASTNLGPEGYELTITTNAVVIRAPTQAGLFYGLQTLRQLLPPEIFAPNLVAAEDWPIRCVRIQDWPRFPWRGVMLDVSRHFYNKSEVEKILDEMALHKLNRFHWHLVDDQGWRIEIKKYPRLTQVGAWRTNSDFEPPNRFPNIKPDWTQPSADKFSPDGRYGGYYTQDDIREVVAYATARHIIIVPEIEMPGHSSAALAAYPQFSCFGGPYSTDNYLNAHPGIYDPAKPGTFIFLDNVLSEVFKLFPGPYVHIGGDEVQKGSWHRSPDCQALMKREGLKNEEELQSYFIKRIEKYVNAHGKTLIGWSEILQGGLAKNAVVMDWIGGGREAASAGHDVVMTPTSYCYLDHYQATNHVTEPRAIGGYLSLQRIYSFEPVPTNLPPEDVAHVLGAQGNLWTEFVASLPHAEFMIFPRASALAEVTWSSKEARNWDDFVARLEVDEQRLDQWDVNYRRGTDQPVDGETHTHAARGTRSAGAAKTF